MPLIAHIALAGPEQGPADGDPVELDRQGDRRSCRCGRDHLRPGRERTPGGAGENDVVHLLPEDRAGAWAPSTHAIAPTTLDFPEPLGPTTTVTPVFEFHHGGTSANDLKPLRGGAL